MVKVQKVFAFIFKLKGLYSFICISLELNAFYLNKGIIIQKYKNIYLFHTNFSSHWDILVK